MFLLVDIYDLAVRQGDQNYKFEEDDKSEVDFIEDQEVSQFYEYLLKAEKVKESEVIESLGRKGLIFK